MNCASKTSNFSLISISHKQFVVAFKRLLGNQRGYLNLVHYLRYLLIGINHPLTKANLKRDRERDNFLPVPSAIKFTFLLDVKDNRLTFCCSPSQIRQAVPSPAWPPFMLLPFPKSAEVVAYGARNPHFCLWSGAMGCWAPLCPQPSSLLPHLPFAASCHIWSQAAQITFLSPSRSYIVLLCQVEFSSSEMGNPVLPRSKW